MDDRIKRVSLVGGGCEIRIHPHVVSELGVDGLTATLATEYTPGDLGSTYFRGGLWRIPVRRRDE